MGRDGFVTGWGKLAHKGGLPKILQVGNTPVEFALIGQPPDYIARNNRLLYINVRRLDFSERQVTYNFSRKMPTNVYEKWTR